MLDIFICEDDLKHRSRIETIVNKHLISDDFNMDIALSVGDPVELLRFLENTQVEGGLYFIDIELQSEINGLDLATKIRKMQASATIVFVTTYSDLAHLTFRHKIEAMDYIIKDLPSDKFEHRLIECMKLAYQRFLDGKHAKTKFFVVKAGEQMFQIPHDDILFFEKRTNVNTSHKIVLYTENNIIEFRGFLKDIEPLSTDFHACHKSAIINLSKVRRVNRYTREVELIDGTILPVSMRKIAELFQKFSVSKSVSARNLPEK